MELKRRGHTVGLQAGNSVAAGSARAWRYRGAGPWDGAGKADTRELGQRFRARTRANATPVKPKS